MRYFILLLIVIINITGCGSAYMKNTMFDPATGKILSVNEVSYKRLGSGELSTIDINLKTGKAKIGGQKGNAGDLTEAFLNLTEIAKSAILIP
jgi:hypothetical protein